MKHILIVEDEKTLAQAYQTILERHGYATEIAYNGEEALASVRKAVPALILLDMKMPKMNGLEFLRNLEKEDIKLPKTTTVIFTNQEDQPDIDEAFRLGAKKYILKAWASPQNLVKLVDEALKK